MIDKNALTQFEEFQMEGKPDIILEMIESFLLTAPKHINAINTYVDQHDIVNSAKEAHSLKSSAHTVGAVIVGNLCQKIEDLKETVNYNDLVKYREELNVSYTKSYEELIQMKQQREKKSRSESP